MRRFVHVDMQYIYLYIFQISLLIIVVLQFV